LIVTTLVFDVGQGSDFVPNIIIGFVILVLVIGFLIYGAKILLAFRQFASLSTSQRQFRKLTWFLMLTLILGLCLLISILLDFVRDWGEFTLNYVWRILEFFICISILVMLTLPRSQSLSPNTSKSTELPVIVVNENEEGVTQST